MSIQTKQKNILITASTFPRWKNDTELSLILNLAAALARLDRGYNIFVLAPHYKGAKKEEELNGIKIYRFKYFFISQWEKLCYKGGILANIKRNKFIMFLVPFFVIYQILAIGKIVKRHKINLIHANWLIPQGLTAVLYKHIFNNKIIILCTIHGTDVSGLRNKLFNLIKKWVLVNIDSISTISRNLQLEIMKYTKLNIPIPVIHNGMDTKYFYPRHKSALLKKKYNVSSWCLLFVGRLVEKKGVKYLIHAMPHITSAIPQVRLLIVGAGPELNNLKKLTRQVHMDNKILFLGAISNDELPQIYSLADLFIGPSVESEGLGVVFIEAMACGTPIIASDLGGIPDIIKDGYNGLLVPQKNSQAIAEAVIYLLKDRAKREEFSSHARSFVIQNLEWDKISLKYSNIYDKLLNNFR